MKIRALVACLLTACGAEDPPPNMAPDAEPPPPPACPDPGTPAAAADLVLGQADFTSVEPNAGGESASSLYYPDHLWSDGTKLWVGDGVNARVLQWDALPSANGEPADLVIGQMSFTSTQAGRSAERMGGQASIDISTGGGKLVVVDGANNRILIWNQLPTANGTPADLVLGQPDFTSIVGGAGADQFSGVNSAWTDGTRLVASDYGNNRVLIWTTFPTVNTQPADLVLGQSGFDISGAPVSPPTASSLALPSVVFSDGTSLYVADAGNNRVLVWTTFPTANNQPADLVLGHDTFTDSAPNGGADCPTAATMSYPMDVHASVDTLAVADRNNHRVLLFDLPLTSSGAAAVDVIGQSNFTSSALAPSPSGDRLNSPSGVLFVGDALYVASPYWNRVSRFL